MNRAALRPVALWLILAGTWPGCSRSGGPERAEEARPGEAITEVPAASLPEAADYLPPLDNGRIEVATPEGWTPASRSGNLVARFVRSPVDRYPTILLTAADNARWSDVTRENVADFAAAVAGQANAGRALPVVIGSFVGAAYQKRGREAGSTSRVLDRLLLTTVLAGRQYTLELRTRSGELEDARPALYAVAHSLRARPTASTAPEGIAPSPEARAEPPTGPRASAAEGHPAGRATRADRLPGRQEPGSAAGPERPSPPDEPPPTPPPKEETQPPSEEPGAGQEDTAEAASERDKPREEDDLDKQLRDLFDLD